jgi:hypothetical protein
MYLISKLILLSILFYQISSGACAFGTGIRSQTPLDWSKIHSTLDHTMAKDAQTIPPYDPIERIRIFSTNDIKVISWLRLAFVYGAHQLDWRWYTPEGKLQLQDSAKIEDPNTGQGEYWENFTASSQLPIKGNPPENMNGAWKVEIYQDGEKIFTEDFQLVTPQSLEGTSGLASNSNPPLSIQFQTEAADPINRCVYYSTDNQRHQLYKIRVYAVGPDLSKVKSIKYILHETFEHPEYTSIEASNGFEMELWTWGSFTMPIIVTTIEGREYNYMYPFTFRNKLVEAQNKGYRFIEVPSS